MKYLKQSVTRLFGDAFCEFKFKFWLNVVVSVIYNSSPLENCAHLNEPHEWINNIYTNYLAN